MFRLSFIHFVVIYINPSVFVVHLIITVTNSCSLLELSCIIKCSDSNNYSLVIHLCGSKYNIFDLASNLKPS